MSRRPPGPDAVADRLAAFGGSEMAQALGRAVGEVAELYLVGGSVRDLLLGIESHDHDFIVPRDALDVARSVADRCRGSYVPLDLKRCIARVVLTDGRRGEHLDFANFQQPTLEADLAARDLTINAMAIDFTAVVGGAAAALIDPTGGRDDLCAGVVRCPSSRVLDDDPLRTLRAVRFACTLGFTLDAATREALPTRGARLSSVAGERVRDELFKMLGSDASYAGIALLEQCGLLGFVFPELDDMRGLAQGPFHHLDVFEHTLRAMEMIDVKSIPAAREMLADARPLSRHLEREIGWTGRTPLQCLRLGALLHDVGKPAARQLKDDGRVSYEGHERIGADMVPAICMRLKLSRQEVALLTHVVRWHLEPLVMKPLEELRPRDLRHYFREVGTGAVETLIVALADSEASAGPANTHDVRAAVYARIAALLRWHFSDAPARCRPLLDGDAIGRLLGLSPGPQIGRLLEALADAQADGEVNSIAGAERWVLESASRPAG